MSKKKRRLVEDEIDIGGMGLVEIIEAVHARGGKMKHAVFEGVHDDDYGSYYTDACDPRPIVRFKRPETEDERRVRKNPKPPQRLVFTSSDPLANLGATAPPEPGFIVSDTMPVGVPDGTIWINTGPDIPKEDLTVNATPPETRPRWALWAGLTALVFAILYLALLVFGLVTHR